ncbi:hypothetical protein BKA93DRAFT_162118 [Sparassis latifolia]
MRTTTSSWANSWELVEKPVNPLEFMLTTVLLDSARVIPHLKCCRVGRPLCLSLSFSICVFLKDRKLVHFELYRCIHHGACNFVRVSLLGYSVAGCGCSAYGFIPRFVRLCHETSSGCLNCGCDRPIILSPCMAQGLAKSCSVDADVQMGGRRVRRVAAGPRILTVRPC